MLETDHKKAKHGQLAVSVTMLVASTVTAILLCEAGLRLLLPQSLAVSYKTRDDLTIHRPDHHGVFKSVETVQEYQMNSFGMRDLPRELVKQKDTFRILLLGDSFMEALQVPFHRSFPQLLEARLKELTGRSIEVINAGVAGWGTDEELTYLTRYGLRFSPDLVLVGMTLHNDIYDNMEQNFHVMEGDRLVEKRIEEIDYIPYMLWRVKAYLGSHSHLYQLFRTWWHTGEIEKQGRELSDQVAQLFMVNPSESVNRGWQLTFSLLREIRTVGAKTGVRSIVFLIPLALQIDHDRLSQLLRDHHLAPDMIELDRPQRMMKSFGDTIDMAVVDLLPPFRQWTSSNRSYLYLKKDGHWTEDGHQLAANRVAESLIQEKVFDKFWAHQSNTEAAH